MYRVYIIDDDETFLSEIYETIPWQDNGFVVIGKNTDSRIALDEITTLSPDVIFTDFKMPKRDGLSLIALLKERKVACEYVMVSAYGESRDILSFLRLEGFDYILKPLQLDDVQIVLERLGKKLVQKKVSNIFPNEQTNSAHKFEELVEFVQNNSNKKFTLDKLGKKYGFSPNYICHLFAKRYNTTFTRFVTDIRMGESIKMLNNEEKALKEIAIDCGYSDYWHFFKVFKEHFGISPTQYKNKMTQNGGDID